MKKALLVLFYSLISVMLYGQGFAVSADIMNVAYIGVDNPLTIVAEGFSCNQLVVSCENGTLIKTGECTYILNLDKEGSAEVLVNAKTSSGLKHIGSKKFRVKLIPNPTATIAGKTNGLMAAAVFKAQLGVLANYPGFDFERQFKVTACKVEFFRNSQLLYGGSNVGPFFNVNTISAMKNLKSGDQISITEIKAISPDSRERTLNEINLRLN